MILFFCLLGFAAEKPVATVTNPIEQGPLQVVFEEDLRFGGDDEAHNLWSDGQVSVFFAVNSAGHMFICDIKAASILEFDSNGKFVRELATKGEGPGEYQNITSFHILEDGKMIGHDSLRAISQFTYYGQDGGILDTKTITDASKIFRRTNYAPSGKYFFSGYMSRNEATQSIDYKTAFFDADFNEIKVLSQTPRPRPSGPPRVNDSDWWVDLIALQLRDFLERGSVFIKFLPNNEILFVHEKQYEIEKWSPDFKTQLMKIQKDYKPVPFTGEDKSALVEYLRESIFEQAPQMANIVTTSVLNKATEKAELPQVHLPIADIIPMEDGAFLTVHDASFKTGKIAGDLFDAEGHCVGTFKFPGSGVYDLYGTRLIFKNGYAYAMERTDLGDNVMVRYKYSLKKN